MTVMDGFREEREALIKHGTPKEKVWHVFIAVLVVTAGICTILELMSKKDTVLWICLLNASELDVAGYNAGFAETIGMDTDRCELIFDAGMEHSSNLMVSLAAGEYDIMITDKDSIASYSYQEDFFTMEELLTPELYEKYKPCFYYIDLAILEEWQTFTTDYDNLLMDKTYRFPPNPRKPEEMESPVAVGIFLDECEKLKECYHFKNNDVVFSVFSNTSHKETALQYLDYLMQ